MAQGSSGATNLRDRGYSSSTDGYKSNTSTPSPQQNITISTSSQVSCGSSSSSSSTNTSSSSSSTSSSSTASNLSDRGYSSSTDGYKAPSTQNKPTLQQQIQAAAAAQYGGAGSGGKIVTTVKNAYQMPQASYNKATESINLSAQKNNAYQEVYKKVQEAALNAAKNSQAQKNKTGISNKYIRNGRSNNKTCK